MKAVKGQVSIEFLTYFVIMLLALSFLTGSLTDRQANFLEFRERIAAQQILIDVGEDLEELDTSNVRGSQIRIEKPRYIYGNNYTISVNSGGSSLMIQWDEKTTSYPIRFNSSETGEVNFDSRQFPITIYESESGEIEYES